MSKFLLAFFAMVGLGIAGGVSVAMLSGPIEAPVLQPGQTYTVIFLCLPIVPPCYAEYVTVTKIRQGGWIEGVNHTGETWIYNRDQILAVQPRQVAPAQHPQEIPAAPPTSLRVDAQF